MVLDISALGVYDLSIDDCVRQTVALEMRETHSHLTLYFQWADRVYYRLLTLQSTVKIAGHLHNLHKTMIIT